MKKTIALACLSFFLLGFGCKKNKTLNESQPAITTQASSYLIPAEQSDDTLLWYSKTPCFGACPTFSFLIKMNGEVTYHGKQHVAKLGEFKGTWTKNQLVELEEEMKKIDFYHFQKLYDDAKITDLPYMYIGYTKGNNLHKIKCRYQYPSEIKALSQWLDEKILSTTFNNIEKTEKR